MKILMILIFLILTLTAFGQVKDTSDIIIDPIEQMPIFPGGENGIWCFLESNLNLDILNKDKISIKYYIKFKIDTLGNASDFIFLATKPIITTNFQLDSLKRAEILRVLNIMPRWEPAVQYDRKKISVWFSIPIKTPYTDFRCKKNNSP